MINFLSDFFIGLLGAATGVILAMFLGIQLIKRSFFRPKLYVKNIRIVPSKGEIDEDVFRWGGLIVTAEICNDSSHWAYDVRISSVDTEVLPKYHTFFLGNIPFRLSIDLPLVKRQSKQSQKRQPKNLGPGANIPTTIKIVTKSRVTLLDYKQLIQELRQVQIRMIVAYENPCGITIETRFWLDLQQGHFTNAISDVFPVVQVLKSSIEPKNGKSKKDLLTLHMERVSG